MALYGLAVFNLHYWGFGVPFILVGAWLLVRAYRLQRDLREATGDAPARPGPTPAGRRAAERLPAPAQQALHPASRTAQALPAQARERAKSRLTSSRPRPGTAGVRRAVSSSHAGNTGVTSAETPGLHSFGGRANRLPWPWRTRAV